MNLIDSRSIKFRITALTTLLIAPLVIVFSLIILSLAAANREAIELQRFNSVIELSAAVERYFAEVKGELTGIAVSVASHPFDNLKFDQQLAKRAGLVPVTGIWSFSLDGGIAQQFVDVSPQSPNHILSNDFISRVFSGEFAVSGVSGVGLSDATVVIAVPVFNESGTVAFGLAAEVNASVFNRAFAEAGMKRGWVAGVVDQNGNFVARNIDPEIRVGTAARPELATAARGTPTSGTFENVTFEGMPVFNSFQRSPLTHWTSVVAVPKSALKAPLRTALIYSVLVGLAAMGLSILAAIMMAGRIAEPVINLGRYATALAEGRKVEPERYRITEIEKVRSSLDLAMAKSARLATLVASAGDVLIAMAKLKLGTKAPNTCLVTRLTLLLADPSRFWCQKNCRMNLMPNGRKY